MNMSMDSGMGMGMGMDMGGASCKISMLWNWYTIDACFLASSWHIRSSGAFAASCIGVALLTVCLEGSRRVAKEFDLYTRRQWQALAATRAQQLQALSKDQREEQQTVTISFRSTPLQNLIRALIHTVTFGVAYIIMLLAMYFNGYIIISIFIGAGIGKFLFDWDKQTFTLTTSQATLQDGGSTSWAQNESSKNPTVCCG